MVIVRAPLLPTEYASTSGEGHLAPQVKFYAGTNATLCIDQPCVVVAGKDIAMDIVFQAPKYLDSIKPNIVATAAGISLDYPLFQDDACVGITNTYCPIVENETVEYSYTMHLLDVFPEITVSLEFTLVDKNDSSDIICFVVDIQVVKTID
ncbi:hypothetical protein NQ318_020575 [Aromia moschata]|uniref:MD-2-related lipid-recognition domain-containing protein n=1 Tax=Aromia moschata TaxID=1265417 RepID=A0AAV8Z0K0_9CUCU|nr:hypothetical protein NQ318_020575 [Aromia moschata]